MLGWSPESLWFGGDGLPSASLCLKDFPPILVALTSPLEAVGRWGREGAEHPYVTQVFSGS